MTRAEDRPDVVVIGGGLAGISAALELAEAGRSVTLVEGRPWLGGATCSFLRRGLTIDNGQHIFLRCFTAYRDLLARLGMTVSCVIQDRLDLTVLAADTGGAAQARLRRSALPPPAHLAGALARYRLLSVTERARVAAAAMMLRFADVGTGNDRNLAGWLADHGQHERARTMLWDWLCSAALNTPPERADLSLAAATLRATVLAGRDKADIGVPSVPFSELHSAPAAALLGQLGVTIRLSTRAAAVESDPAGGYEVAVVAEPHGRAADPGTTTEPIRTAAVVLAVPPGEAVGLASLVLPGAAARWSLLRTSPVVSLHVVYDRPVTGLPFAVVAGSPVRWVIDKTSAAGLHAGQYLAATLPAADRYVDAPAAQLRESMLALLDSLFPEAAEASVEDFFVTRERRATIWHEPGVQRLRAVPGTGPGGLAVAGAWTETSWPDTMEGAVRSGRSAARRILVGLAGGTAPAADDVTSAAPAPAAGGR